MVREYLKPTWLMSKFSFVPNCKMLKSLNVAMFFLMIVVAFDFLMISVLCEILAFLFNLFEMSFSKTLVQINPNEVITRNATVHMTSLKRFLHICVD